MFRAGHNGRFARPVLPIVIFCLFHVYGRDSSSKSVFLHRGNDDSSLLDDFTARILSYCDLEPPPRFRPYITFVLKRSIIRKERSTAVIDVYHGFICTNSCKAPPLFSCPGAQKNANHIPACSRNIVKFSYEGSVLQSLYDTPSPTLISVVFDLQRSCAAIHAYR